VTTQIAVRLPDDLVVFVDELVASGQIASRADLVRKALRREQRRVLAERDVEKLLRHGDDSELADFVSRAATTALDID